MSKPSKRSSERRQFWQMAIDTHQASGLSIQQFCKNEGLNSTLFYSWRKRLAQDNGNRQPETGSSRQAPEPAQTQASPGFVEVSLPPNSTQVELVLCSGNTLKFHPAIAKEELVNICSVLGDLKSC